MHIKVFGYIGGELIPAHEQITAIIGELRSIVCRISSVHYNLAILRHFVAASVKPLDGIASVRCGECRCNGEVAQYFVEELIPADEGVIVICGGGLCRGIDDAGDNGILRRSAVSDALRVQSSAVIVFEYNGM